jgi:hypothetical protein
MLTNLDDTGKKFRSTKVMTCDGVQLFSDPQWSIPNDDSPLPLKSGPFDPDRPDELGVQIEIQTGRTTITLAS